MITYLSLFVPAAAAVAVAVIGTSTHRVSTRVAGWEQALEGERSRRRACERRIAVLERDVADLKAKLNA